MSRVLYFDCFSGISGDMALGALLDAGLPLADLTRALGSLAMSGYHVHSERVLRANVSATRFVVHEHQHGAPQHSAHQHGAHQHGGIPAPAHPGTHEQKHEHGHEHGHEHAAVHVQGHPHRSLPEIFALIDTSALTPAGRDRAKAMFQRLAQAEAAIHAMPVDQVHLHEVGALDSIIDIVGIVFALEWAGADRIVSSPLNVGGGMVHSAHGVFPVPAPATVTLLGSAPVYASAVQKELVTPTGALIVSSYATAFGPIPAMSIERVGYGAGERDDPTTPNVLRVLIGQEPEQGVQARSEVAPEAEQVVVIECEIDDMNPQIFGVAMERLYAAGALEVFYVAVQMKKNRPGTLLTVIAPPERRVQLCGVIFRETTTIGLRHHLVARECLRREIVTVETPIGPVRFKVAWRDGRVVNAVPEFEDCVTLAAANNLSVKDVQAIAARAYTP